MKSVPCVVILETFLESAGLDVCVTVRVRARSSLSSESDLDEVGEVPVGDQNSLCESVRGEAHGLSGHCDMTTAGGFAFSGSDIVGAKDLSPRDQMDSK